MFISIILNTEYMDIASRSKWYLKNLLHCKENGWILITHEYMRTHWTQLQEEITPSLFSSWEMQPFAAEDVKDVEQYFIPDELFEAIEKQCGSRTEMLWQLSTTNNTSVEKVLHNIISEIKLKHPHEKIDGIFHCIEAWQSIRNVCEENNIPLISYSFSAVRKPHGYRQTLYHANSRGYLHTSQESEIRYLQFCEENQSIPIFTHKELIALFGKERTLPLITLINAMPKWEMGICTECFSVIPQFFVHNKITEDDVRLECEKLYNDSQIVVRNHSLQVDAMQLDRSVVHNDPAAWILSCKRLTSARSQIMLKSLLWNRTTIVRANTLGFSFMCAKDYSSIEKVELKALNWYMFGYLIPNDLMYSNSYWKWRLTNPSETEIYQRHLSFYIKAFNLSVGILTEHNKNKRLHSILKRRGCDEDLIKIIIDDNQDFDIDFDTASSRIVVNGRSYWRLNKLINGRRYFHIELDEYADTIEFYPLDDVAGCAKLHSVSINGNLINVSQFADYKYMPKLTGHYSLQVASNSNKLNICIYWDYQSNDEFLKTHS